MGSNIKDCIETDITWNIISKNGIFFIPYIIININAVTELVIHLRYATSKTKKKLVLNKVEQSNNQVILLHVLSQTKG